MEKKNSGLGVASFVVGIVSMFVFQLILVPIAALVLGIVALSNFDSETQKGKWMAVTGVVLGSIYTLTAIVYSLR